MKSACSYWLLSVCATFVEKTIPVYTWLKTLVYKPSVQNSNTGYQVEFPGATIRALFILGGLKCLPMNRN